MDRDSEAYKLPRPRKVVLVIIISLTFVNMVLLVVTLVRPVPQFSSSSVLLHIQAVATETFGNSTWTPEKRSLTDYGYRVQSPQSFRLSGSAIIREQPGSSPRPSKKLFERANDEAFWLEGEMCYECGQGTEPGPGPAPSPTTYYSTRRVEEHETRTKWKTSTRKVIRTETAALVTRTASARNPTATSVQQLGYPQQGRFVQLWIGPMGICMQKFEGNLACSGASFTADFGPVYNQSGLNSDVVAQLPKNTKGTAVGLLIATMAHSVALVFFAVAISPPLFQFTPYGLARSLDIRHQVTLAINSILTAIAMLSVVAATVVLKNDFGRAVKAIPALDDTLLAENGTAFTQLYLVIVFGGLSLLQCLTLIAEDLRFPWWYLGPAQRHRTPWSAQPPKLDFTAQGLKDLAAQRQQRADNAAMQAYGGMMGQSAPSIAPFAM